MASSGGLWLGQARAGRWGRDPLFGLRRPPVAPESPLRLKQGGATEAEGGEAAGRGRQLPGVLGRGAEGGGGGNGAPRWPWRHEGGALAEAERLQQRARVGGGGGTGEGGAASRLAGVGRSGGVRGPKVLERSAGVAAAAVLLFFTAALGGGSSYWSSPEEQLAVAAAGRL